jgi:hypothetical protein
LRLSGTPLEEHARHLPKNVAWYADPAGAQETASLRARGFAVRKGYNDVRAGIALVHTRLQTGRLKVVAAACPNLLAEAKLYRYPTAQDGRPQSEVPVDEHNHALAALRYLISRLDAHTYHKIRKTDPSREAPAGTENGPDRPRPRLDLRNEQLWHPLG